MTTGIDPTLANDRHDACDCGHDRINHSGPWALVECYNCAQKPRVADVSKPYNADAYFDLMDEVSA
jgi:hypothetical protein